MRTDYQDYNNIFQTVARLQEIANELSVTDLINPGTVQMRLLSELICRIKHIKIEPIDFASQGIMRSFAV